MGYEEFVKAFMGATRGVTAWTVARALRSLTPGIDWRRTSRIAMASEWSKAQLNSSIYPELKHVTLESLTKRISEL